MIFKRLSLLTSVLAIAFAGNATFSFAKTYNAKVRSGKATQLYRFSVYDTRDCGSLAYPKTSFKTTSNGSMTVKKFTGRLKIKGHCNGKIAKGMAVYYKSRSGFRGRDKVTIYFSFPAGADGTGYNNVERIIYNINVK